MENKDIEKSLLKFAELHKKYKSKRKKRRNIHSKKLKVVMLYKQMKIIYDRAEIKVKYTREDCCIRIRAKELEMSKDYPFLLSLMRECDLFFLETLGEMTEIKMVFTFLTFV